MIVWLITFIFKYAVLPVASVLALKELFSFLNLKRYSDQNVKTSYFPFLGFWKLLIFNYLDKYDVTKAFKKERADNKGKDMVVWNDGLTTCSLVELISLEALKEFFEKETDVSIKKNMVETDMVGFFFKNGEVVQTSRAIFSEIFHRDNLQKLCPQLTRVVYKHCAKLKKMWKDSGKEWLTVDIRKDVSPFELTLRSSSKCSTTSPSVSCSGSKTPKTAPRTINEEPFSNLTKKLSIA